MESRADEWERMEGAEELEAFVSGATAEITLKHGVVARGEYSPDGTAKIEAWNEVFHRTWEVRGGVIRSVTRPKRKPTASFWS